MAINLATGRHSHPGPRAYGSEESGSATLGPVIDWQPVR